MPRHASPRKTAPSEPVITTPPLHPVRQALADHLASVAAAKSAMEHELAVIARLDAAISDNEAAEADANALLAADAATLAAWAEAGDGHAPTLQDDATRQAVLSKVTASRRTAQAATAARAGAWQRYLGKAEALKALEGTTRHLAARVLLIEAESIAARGREAGLIEATCRRQIDHLKSYLRLHDDRHITMLVNEMADVGAVVIPSLSRAAWEDLHLAAMFDPLATLESVKLATVDNVHGDKPPSAQPDVTLNNAIGDPAVTEVTSDNVAANQPTSEERSDWSLTYATHNNAPLESAA